MLFSGAAALQVRELQVRAGVALWELTVGRPAGGPGTAARRDAGVVLFLAGPAVDAFRTVPVIEPGRVHGAPPVAWITRQLGIQLPFSRPQESGEPGLAFGQQVAHVGPVVPGPLVLSLNVSAHNITSLDVTIDRSRRPRQRGGMAGNRDGGGDHQDSRVVEDHHAVAKQAPALLGMADHYARGRPVPR
jgi:hypothetical protein